ncbi:lipoate--protein ligase family protein [Halotalea alkalilenta]|uniref:lipoate--protein ligase family protein n=1 Tax=Halotalea alkalilenta TaxID=376489 RepID=UPI000486FB98|nr:biotin/lipoate A/B protein ligase family protein [Halotalea alkalilenta]
MHGEYKVPGGKLVVVDLDEVDGRLSGVRLSGDFFLEPDDLLERIDAALEGAPAGLDIEALAARVRAALPADATLLGLTPEAVGVVVRRALAQASEWRDHRFSLIHRAPEAPALHMALDQVLAEEVAAGRRGPLLRVWEWASPAVIIGSFQSLSNEVDLDAARARGVAVMRRISGGGAMFVEPGNTITWSLVVPESLVQGLSLVDSYAFLDDWVINALQELGIEARYVPINDIVSPAGKIAGAAQKRLRGAVLHHVTMAYDIDVDAMLAVLRIGKEKISDKGIKSSGKRVDPLKSQTGLPRDEIISRMSASFAARAGLEPGELTAAELERAERLAREKFEDPAWLARVP